MKINDTIKLIIAIAICESAGIIGSVFTAPSIPSWYATLSKPALNPPAWVFAPVWTILFALMGIAVFLIWKEKEIVTSSRQGGTPRNDRRINIALGIFAGQLALNVLWSIVFFGSTTLTINGINNIGLAFIEIIILWFAIAWTITAFYKISPPLSSAWITEGRGKLAAYLLLPYIIWVSFAAYLNYSIWMLN